MSGRTRRERLFTVEQVNELIPRLEVIMRRLKLLGVELHRGLAAAALELGSEPDTAAVRTLVQEHPELSSMTGEMEKLVAEIGECGGQFKGLDLGLVDFPAEIEGERGLLCWQFGEREITHWHPEDAGFAGRRPLPSAASKVLLH